MFYILEKKIKNYITNTNTLKIISALLNLNFIKTLFLLNYKKRENIVLHKCI
jgi:hypothetical protein